MNALWSLRSAYSALLSALLAASVIHAQSAPPEKSAGTNVEVGSVAAVGMTVSDLDRAVNFYTTVLDFEKISEIERAGSEIEQLYGVFGARVRVARLKLGDETIELTEYLTPRGRPMPLDSRSQDRWFQHIAIIVSDMTRAYGQLRRHKVQHASTGPQRLPDSNPSAGGIEAFYFKDPDGHTLEILQFPPDKGAAQWHRPGNQLFLGIDHTAVVVEDTDRSLRFYRDLLGFTIAGSSENYGTEQEHLNQVFGARLRITSLRVPVGPAIEFLEYLSPRDGRPYPADARANDILHWQTTLVTPNAEAAARVLRARGSALISADPVLFPGRDLGFRRGFLVRDPDGHVMEIVER
jgi:catechol 2,3-dioxygenase-like lactoylglutathione lyase family enzyme